MLFLWHIIDWPHCEALLQWCYLSEICTTLYINAGNSSLFYLKSRIPSIVTGQEKNMGHLLFGQPT
jgi:hypothetical protein